LLPNDGHKPLIESCERVLGYRLTAKDKRSSSHIAQLHVG